MKQKPGEISIKIYCAMCLYIFHKSINIYFSSGGSCLSNLCFNLRPIISAVN